MGLLEGVVDEAHGLIREAFEITRRAARVPVVYLVGLANESREQRFVAKIIDDTGDSPAGTVDFPQRPWREMGPAHAAGNRETVVDVPVHLRTRKRAQLVMDQD